MPLIVLLPVQRHRHVLVAGMFAAHLTLAAGYWLTADSARGRVAMARWRELEPIAKSMPRQPACVAAPDVSGDDVFILELMVDRRIPFALSGTVPSMTEWILTTRDGGGCAELRGAALRPTRSACCAVPTAGNGFPTNWPGQ